MFWYVGGKMGIVFSKIQNLLYGMLKLQQDRTMGTRA